MSLATRRSLTIEQVLTMLAATPPRIAALTADLAAEQLHTAPRRGEWCANDVLAHLRACADMWGNSILAMVAEDRPTLRAVNPRTWINSTDYLNQAFKPSLRAFAKQRTELLRILRRLEVQGWQRAAIFTGAGAPLERTVLSQAQRLAVHERPHLKQIEAIVNTRRR